MSAPRVRARRRRAVAALVLVAALLVASPAAAYIDPGTGSMLVQALVAGVAGAALATKTYWRRIRAFFGGAPDDDAAARRAPDGRDGAARSEPDDA
ncbi:MAG: hypothetical protein R3E88_19990 [Myxococcota bacterium]